MKPLLDVLVILDVLDKEGSFAAASAKLYKTPSALSYTIHKLESELNIQLLDRSGHRATFTSAGRMLLEKGRDVLQSARELEQQLVKLHDGWENSLTIGIDPTFPLPLLAPLLVEFYRHTRSTQLSLIQGANEELWRALAQGRADMVLGALGEPPVMEALNVLPLGQLSRAYVMAANHPLASLAEPLTHKALRRARAIVLTEEKGTQTRQWPGEQETIVVFDNQTRLLLLLNGVGIAAIPRYQVQKQLVSGELVAKTMGERAQPEFAWIGWNERTTGLSCAWWRTAVLTNSAIKDVYTLTTAY